LLVCHAVVGQAVGYTADGICKTRLDGMEYLCGRERGLVNVRFFSAQMVAATGS